MYNFYQKNIQTGGAMTHAGGFEGANTVHYEILRDEISVLVFSNMNEPVAEQLGAGILDLLRKQTPQPPVLPAIENIYQSYIQYVIKYIEANFESLITNFHANDPKDIIINQIGYNLLFSEDKTEQKQALDFFELNTKLFPNVANVWDSYGEGLVKNNRKEEGLKAYQKALEINPQLATAQKAIKELKIDK